MIDKEIASEVVETLVDLRRGMRNKQTATKEIVRLTGLLPEYAEVLIRETAGQNVSQIRGYEKTPERLIKGRDKHLGRPAKR